MAEIVMLVWLGDVAHSVSFMLGLLLAGCVLVAAVMWVLIATAMITRCLADLFGGWPWRPSSRLWR